MTASDWPDLAGRIVADDGGQRHILPIRVYFEDTDAGGVVYHASFVRFAERSIRSAIWAMPLGVSDSARRRSSWA